MENHSSGTSRLREFGQPVVFFDGTCALCDAYVQWLLRRDRSGVFLFALLEGATGTQLKNAHPEWPDGLDSLVLWEPSATGQATTFWYTDAVLRVLGRLGWPWKVFSWLLWLPRPVRDPGYRFLASVRYRVFGRRLECRVPDPEVASRFLP